MSPLVTYTEFNPSHYQAAYDLWSRTEGVGLSDADSECAITAYLTHHQGLSFVALAGDELIGTCLCGHDLRRGYLHHVAVDPRFRQRGIARELVRRSVHALQQAGIQKCHLFLLAENHSGRAFWQHLGWQLRDDLSVLSLSIGNKPDHCRC